MPEFPDMARELGHFSIQADVNASAPAPVGVRCRSTRGADIGASPRPVRRQPVTDAFHCGGT